MSGGLVHLLVAALWGVLAVFALTMALWNAGHLVAAPELVPWWAASAACFAVLALLRGRRAW